MSVSGSNEVHCNGCSIVGLKTASGAWAAFLKVV